MRLAFLAFLLLRGVAVAADAPPPPLREGEITRAGDVTAYLTHPSEAYKHGVFGKPIEAGGFAIERAGKRLEIRLPPDQVFEDRRVRLMDVDGDGVAEAILVKSTLDKGAALAVYKIGKSRLDLLAETPPIGTANRWLNPVGVVEMNIDGRKFVGAVITPHLSASLRFYELRLGKLVEVTRIDGVTNHINGSRNLDLAAIQDVDGDGAEDVAVPTFDRKALALVSLKGGKAQMVQKVEIKSGRITELTALGPKGRFQVLLDTGERQDISLLPLPPVPPKP